MTTQISLPFTFTQLITVMYYVGFVALVIMSAFIVYHLVRYAYSKKSMAIMLLIFVPTTVSLLFLNLILFNAAGIIATLESLLK